MHLQIHIKALFNTPYNKIKNTQIQQYIKTQIQEIHENKIYNFNITPKTNYTYNKEKTLTITSPNNKLIKHLYLKTKQKYNNYYQEEYTQTKQLFTKTKLKNQITLKMNENYMTLSMYDILEIELNDQNKQFYQYIYETGLGQQNKYGNGYLENIR